MILLELHRVYLGDAYTIGHLYVNGTYFCDTLEDKVRVLYSEVDKVKDKTAIPAGEYTVVMSYSKRFGRILPELLNVPFFDGIRIHAGNDENDTSGCVLVGVNKTKGKVLESKATFERLYSLLMTAWESDEKIVIRIIQ